MQRRLGGVGIRRGVRGGGIGGLRLPASAVLHYDYRFRSTTGSNVDSLTELVGAVSSADIANTGTARPTVVDDSGVEAIQFDRASGQYLTVNAGANVVSVGDHVTAFMIFRLRSTVVNQFYLSLGDPTQDFDCISRLTAGTNLDANFVAPEGSLNPLYAFSDITSYHLVKHGFDASSGVIGVDGTDGTPASLTNTGLWRGGVRVRFGGRNSDGAQNANVMLRKIVVLVNATAGEVASVESQLLGLVP